MNISNNSNDTLLHKLSRNLDLQELQNQVNIDKNKVLSMVNVPDSDGKLPIHIALETIENKIKYNKLNKKLASYNFVAYLINCLGASIYLADSNNRIIVDNSSNTTDSADLNALNNIIIENIKDLSIKTKSNNIKSINITDMGIDKMQQIAFVKSLIESYQINGMDGGYSGKRFIQKYKSESSDDNFDTSDSFLSGSQYVDRYSNSFPMERPRQKPDPKSSERYKEILKKIMDLTGKNEEDSKTLRSYIKLTLHEQDPTLKRVENDDKKTKMIEEIVSTKKSLDEFIKKYLPDSKKKEIQKNMDMQKKLAEERRRDVENNSDNSDKKDKKNKESKNKNGNKKDKQSLISDKSDSKSKKHSKYLNADGYLQSSEIILSSE